MAFVFVKSQQIRADMFLPDRLHLAPLLLFTCLRLSFQWDCSTRFFLHGNSPPTAETRGRRQKTGRKERVILLLLLLQEGSGPPHVTEEDAFIKVQQDDVPF